MAMTETRPTTMQEVVTAERVSALEERLAQLEAQMQQVREELPENRVSIIVFSGDLDKVLPAFIIATGAAAMGMQVSLFFTFWGLNALKKRRDLSGQGLSGKTLRLMTPVGTEGLGVSKMNFFGIGAKLLADADEAQAGGVAGGVGANGAGDGRQNHCLPDEHGCVGHHQR
jgi:hypothetical protein